MGALQGHNYRHLYSSRQKSHHLLKTQNSQTAACNQFLQYTEKHVPYLQNGFIDTMD